MAAEVLRIRGANLPSTQKIGHFDLWYMNYRNMSFIHPKMLLDYTTQNYKYFENVCFFH